VLFLLLAVSLAELLASGRFTEALGQIEPMLKTQPRDPRLWTARGLALRGLSRTRDSIQSFDRALDLEPGFVPALQAAAETAYQARDTRAAGYLDRILRVQPANETAHAMAAVLAFEAKDCTRAVAHFERSRAQAEANELAASQFGQCLLSLGRAEEAVEVFRRVGGTHSRYNLAVAQLQARRPRDAIATLEPLASPPDPEVLNLRAAAQSAAGQPDAAIASLREAVRLAPTDERHYLDLAVLCFQHNLLAVAAEMVAAGIRHIPGSARLYTMRGIIHAQQGDHDQAAADFDQAGRLEPDQAYGSVGLSVLLSQTNRAESITLLRQKVRQAPHDATLNYLLADTLMREAIDASQPEFAEAREALARAVRARPDFAPAHAALGKVYLQSGDTERAVTELELALKIEPANRRALSQLLIALRRLDRRQQAEAVAHRLRDQVQQDLARDLARDAARLVKVPPPGPPGP